MLSLPAKNVAFSSGESKYIFCGHPPDRETLTERGVPVSRMNRRVANPQHRYIAGAPVFAFPQFAEPRPSRCSHKWGRALESLSRAIAASGRSRQIGPNAFFVVTALTATCRHAKIKNSSNQELFELGREVPLRAAFTLRFRLRL